MSKLRKNKDIVIFKPDKGSGVVILNKAYYERKMLQILNDDRKFCELRKLPQCDKTASNERKLQSLLLCLKKSNQINDGFYQRARSIDSERPRMYGLPKTHKEGTPLRPILSMIKSAQHNLAKELSLLLGPVPYDYLT